MSVVRIWNDGTLGAYFNEADKKAIKGQKQSAAQNALVYQKLIGAAPPWFVDWNLYKPPAVIRQQSLKDAVGKCTRPSTSYETFLQHVAFALAVEHSPSNPPDYERLFKWAAQVKEGCDAGDMKEAARQLYLDAVQTGWFDSFCTCYETIHTQFKAPSGIFGLFPFKRARTIRTSGGGMTEYTDKYRALSDGLKEILTPNLKSYEDSPHFFLNEQVWVVMRRPDRMVHKVVDTTFYWDKQTSTYTIETPANGINRGVYHQWEIGFTAGKVTSILLNGTPFSTPYKDQTHNFTDLQITLLGAKYDDDFSSKGNLARFQIEIIPSKGNAATKYTYNISRDGVMSFLSFVFQWGKTIRVSDGAVPQGHELCGLAKFDYTIANLVKKDESRLKSGDKRPWAASFADLSASCRFCAKC